MKEIYFSGNKVKDIIIYSEHEEGVSLASEFETGMVDKIEAEERGGIISFRHYLDGELQSERLIHLSKISSIRILYNTKYGFHKAN